MSGSECESGEKCFSSGEHQRQAERKLISMRLASKGARKNPPSGGKRHNISLTMETCRHPLGLEISVCFSVYDLLRVPTTAFLIPLENPLLKQIQFAAFKVVRHG